MTRKQIMHCTGLAAGVGGYASFLALSITGIAAAPAALFLMPAGLVLALATADR